MGANPHRITWTDTVRAECYAAYIGGKLRAWCADRGLDVHDTACVARRWATTRGLPTLRPAGKLAGADLTRPVDEVAAAYGVSTSAVHKARKNAGITAAPTPRTGTTPRERLMAAPLEELARTPVSALCRRYKARPAVVCDVRAARGVGGTRPDLLVWKPAPGHAAAKRAAMTEDEEIAHGAPAAIRIGRNGYSIDSRSPAAAALLDVPAFNPDAEPDPRWLARFEARTRVAGDRETP